MVQHLQQPKALDWEIECDIAHNFRYYFVKENPCELNIVIKKAKKDRNLNAISNRLKRESALWFFIAMRVNKYDSWSRRILNPSFPLWIRKTAKWSYFQQLLMFPLVVDAANLAFQAAVFARMVLFLHVLHGCWLQLAPSNSWDHFEALIRWIVLWLNPFHADAAGRKFSFGLTGYIQARFPVGGPNGFGGAIIDFYSISCLSYKTLYLSHSHILVGHKL